MRTTTHQRTRPFDVLLTLALLGLGVVAMVGDIESDDPTTRVDSHSWWALVVYLAAVLPLLWWRRDSVVAATASAVVMAVHVVAFGWTVRCGSGLPLTWVLAYLVGTRSVVRRSALGLVAAEVLGAMVLLRDSAAGPSLIPIEALITLGVWGIGRVVRQRAELADQLVERNEELARVRDLNAGLEVSGDRARLSAELEGLLDERLAQLAAAARPEARDAGETRQLLSTLEEDSRRILVQMRDIVGELRGGEVALAPAPSVAHLDALVARRCRGDARLAVVGSPRALPASVELSAYRVVEHLLDVLADVPEARIDVGVSFSEEALEVSVAGPVQRGADVRGAVARARERVRLQEGTLNVKLARGRARVVAHLPVVPV